MSRLSLSTLGLGALLLLAGLPSAAVADKPAGKRFTNLKVMPKDTTKEQMKKVMKAQSVALGVDCEFCHEENDMASDKNEHKLVARQMMKMTREINAKWFGKDKGAEFVSCAMCHRGKSEPPDFVPPPKPEQGEAGDGKAAAPAQAPAPAPVAPPVPAK